MCAHPAWIEIDLDQLEKNIAIVRGRVGERFICLPVKANAYGHGLVPVAKLAVSAGVDYLGVAHLQEGITLREAGVEIPILVLGAIHEDQVKDLVAHRLEFAVGSIFKAELVARGTSEKARIHIKVDTGMQRTGVRLETAPKLMSRLDELGCFETVGIYSHFANADTPSDPLTRLQLASFLSLKQDPLFKERKLIWHIANSGAVVHFPESYLDMVRPSGLVFGCSSHLLEGVAPCFGLKARVSYFKVVEGGQGISYGHAYVTSKRTRVVTIPVGYGDGYRRALSNKGEVVIRGKRFPIVGMICMDQFMVDVGDHEVFVGDEVTLIGEGIPLNETAKLCDTINYEILCGFNNRLPRLYKRARLQEPSVL